VVPLNQTGARQAKVPLTHKAKILRPGTPLMEIWQRIPTLMKNQALGGVFTLKNPLWLRKSLSITVRLVVSFD
jgi:hypothetical protein